MSFAEDTEVKPAHLLQRTYTVVFVPSSIPNGVNGTFPGASITVNSFSGSFLPGRTSFPPTPARWDFSFVIGERLPDGKVLTMNGRASVGESNLLNQFNGRIALYEPSTGDVVARCDAGGFTFLLTR